MDNKPNLLRTESTPQLHCTALGMCSCKSSVPELHLYVLFVAFISQHSYTLPTINVVLLMSTVVVYIPPTQRTSCSVD